MFSHVFGFAKRTRVTLRSTRTPDDVIAYLQRNLPGRRAQVIPWRFHGQPEAKGIVYGRVRPHGRFWLRRRIYYGNPVQVRASGVIEPMGLAARVDATFSAATLAVGGVLVLFAWSLILTGWALFSLVAAWFDRQRLAVDLLVSVACVGLILLQLAAFALATALRDKDTQVLTQYLRQMVDSSGTSTPQPGAS